MTHIAYLWDTAPFCGSAPCYVHGMAWGEAEHHVQECFASKSLAGQHHLLQHAILVHGSSSFLDSRVKRLAVRDVQEAVGPVERRRMADHPEDIA